MTWPCYFSTDRRTALGAAVSELCVAICTVWEQCIKYDEDGSMMPLNINCSLCMMQGIWVILSHTLTFTILWQIKPIRITIMSRFMPAAVVSHESNLYCVTLLTSIGATECCEWPGFISELHSRDSGLTFFLQSTRKKIFQIKQWLHPSGCFFN
jgi:hypothetical protein